MLELITIYSRTLSHQKWERHKHTRSPRKYYFCKMSRGLFAIGVDQKLANFYSTLTTRPKTERELDEKNWLAKRPHTKFFTVCSDPLTLRFNHWLLTRGSMGRTGQVSTLLTHASCRFKLSPLTDHFFGLHPGNAAIWNQWTILFT